ncbi:CynX/NimT family MFS transporter [Bosea sp. F3-2]|uniref:cyanate transporter n=1 Tax=Bosea sp. F3-2 TaxID=2599640 RepID=UPI0011ED1787|nr:cyanate transporter [Bosea sp. F3-2]QEL24255.1 CynX/NimT family MFS transporter [Bosea sp. F3-2]
MSARKVHPAPSRLLLLAVVVLVGLNLRPFLTGIGPLASRIQEATGLDYRAMSLFTLVPMVLMGVCVLAGRWVERVAGARAAIIAALLVLCLASALRLVVENGYALIVTAAFCGIGVAIVQAVFPGIIKAHFPRQVAVMMGLYSAMLMGGGALGAQASPLVADLTGSWHAGLAWIAAPAFLAALLSAFTLPRGRSVRAGALRTGLLLRRPRTWLLMACFGLVNGGYSSIVAWLAPYYQTLGWTSAASGTLLAAMATSQAAAALAMPALAARRQDRRPWIILALGLQIVGFAGIAFSPNLAPIGWSVLVGAGLGGAFALSMVVALDHLENPADAGALSALMQGGGFLLAGLSPWIVAVLRDHSGSFATGWLMHLGCAALVTVLALRFVPHGYARSMNVSVGGDPEVARS